MVGIQALINLGSTSGLLPITGVPLPFISYGGSSLLVLMAAMGILNNIAMNVKKEQGDSATIDSEQHSKMREYQFQARKTRSEERRVGKERRREEAKHRVRDNMD